MISCKHKTNLENTAGCRWSHTHRARTPPPPPTPTHTQRQGFVVVVDAENYKANIQRKHVWFHHVLHLPVQDGVIFFPLYDCFYVCLFFLFFFLFSTTAFYRLFLLCFFSFYATVFVVFLSFFMRYFFMLAVDASCKKGPKHTNSLKER